MTIPVPELTIVVPVFKEGGAVDPVMRALTAAIATTHEILIVYDFAEDPTVPVIERLHADLPPSVAFGNDLGRGVLNAMKAGIAASRGDLRDDFDGGWLRRAARRGRDGRPSPGRRGRGVRVRATCGGGRQLGPAAQALMSRAAGLTLRWFGGIATHDPTNNFKLYCGVCWM